MPTVLVIIYEKSLRQSIAQLLAAENFDILEAENGRVGVELAIHHLPDLILCDEVMPEFDGYAVLQQLRQNTLAATIPLILITDAASSSNFRQNLGLSADDYLSKPFTPDHLLNTISTRLEKRAVIEQNTQKQLDELRKNIRQSLPHELRTSLNSILGFSDLLMVDLEDLSKADIREIIEQIHHSGLQLYQLIQKFLFDVELQLISQNPERVAIFRQACTNHSHIVLEKVIRQQAKELGREQDLSYSLVESRVCVATHHLAKLLEEILSNALKFSQVGTPITVNSQEEGQFLAITVSNYGRGMTLEQIQKMGAYMQFERQLQEQQGSGLGLAIAKRLVHLYGGHLTIESIPEQMTTVRILLPTTTISD